MDWQAIIIIVGPVGIYLDNIHETMRFVHRHHRLINGADRRNEIGQINLEEIKVVGGQLGSGIGEVGGGGGVQQQQTTDAL